MRAALMHRLVPDLSGELVTMGEFPGPRVTGPHDVVVEIAGAGVCRTELHVLDGMLPPPALPHVLGHENAGYVAEVGDAVTTVSPDDPVLCYPFITSGLSYPDRDGLAQAAPDRRGPGLDMPGGYATHVLSHERSLVPLPTGVDPTDLAPLADAGVTAYHACARLDLSPGDRVVVLGVGGLGHLAIQILAAISPAEVIAADTRPEALELAEDCGVHQAVHPSDLPLVLGDDPPAAVIDFVGSSQTSAAGVEMLDMGGRYLAVGVGGELSVPLLDLVARGISVEGVYVGTYRHLVEVTILALSGEVFPRVTRYPLDQANQALHDLAQGRLLGRAVLVP